MTGPDRVARVDPATLELAAESALPVADASETGSTRRQTPPWRRRPPRAASCSPTSTRTRPHSCKSMPPKAHHRVWLARRDLAVDRAGARRDRVPRRYVRRVGCPTRGCGHMRAADNAGSDLWVLADAGARGVPPARRCAHRRRTRGGARFVPETFRAPSTWSRTTTRSGRSSRPVRSPIGTTRSSCASTPGRTRSRVRSSSRPASSPAPSRARS